MSHRCGQPGGQRHLQVSLEAEQRGDQDEDLRDVLEGLPVLRTTHKQITLFYLRLCDLAITPLSVTPIWYSNSDAMHLLDKAHALFTYTCEPATYIQQSPGRKSIQVLSV